MTLQTVQVTYHTPPQFPEDVIKNIREGASLLFQQLGLRDFARIDGWFLPPSADTDYLTDNKFGRSDSGTVVFTDINLVRIFNVSLVIFLFYNSSHI